MHHMHGFRRNHWGRGVGFAVLIVLGVAAITWVVMQLWNALLPEIFGWRTITFLQALGLLLLSKIFFGGWHRGGHRHGCHHHGGHGWAHLSDEERAKMRARFRDRCCGVDNETNHPDSGSTSNNAS